MQATGSSFNLIAIAAVLLLYLSHHHRATQALEDHATSTEHPSRLHTSLCPKSWIHQGHKCYRITPSPRNFENAKGRCHDLSAKLAVIDDEPNAREKESSSSAHHPSNIISYLTLMSAEQRKPEFQSRQYYVTLSDELMMQHQELKKNGFYSESSISESYDADVSISELWLPRDDPSLSFLVNNITEATDTFVLAYSKRLGRWGLISVAPVRKMFFICERLASNASSNQPSANQAPGAVITINPSQDVDVRRTEESSSNMPHTTYSVVHQGSSPSSPTSSTTSTPNSTQSEPSSLLFREHPQDQSIVLGSTAELRCSALESESALFWTYNGKNLTLSNRVKLQSSGNLRIEHVRNTDDGNYTCTIHAGSITESKAARLEIIERPHQPEYINAELLDKLSPSVRVTWTPGFNGNSPIIKYLVEMMTVTSDNIDNDFNNLIRSDKWEVARANISADQTSVIIADLKPARKYIFRIKATNRVGTGDPSIPTRHPVEVPVQPPSMPPEKLNGSPKSSTSIAINWSPPPTDHQNGVIKGYKIRHKLADYASDSEWITRDVADASRLNYALEDLIEWQNYEIQVAAENDKGVGPFSPGIYIRTKEGKPNRSPRTVKVEALSSTSIKVDWKPPPPQHINGINLGYKVNVWADPGYTQTIRDLVVPHNTASPFHSVAVDGLVPYTEYYVTVRCYTSAGDGPPNEDVVSVKTKQDLPEAVQSLEFADVLDKSLRVLWKPPRRINGELDHYTIEYSESSSSERKTIRKYPAGVTEARITDLQPQTTYSFKIYPHTNVGQGPSKSNSTTTSVPPVLPEPPSHLIPSNIGPYSVTISFEPGFDGNASIEKWIAEAATASRVEYAPRWQNIYVSTNHSQGNSVVVRNLRPYTRYMIRLTPANIVGPSRYPSEPTDEFQTAQVEPEQPPKDLSLEEVKSNSAVAHWSPLAKNLWLGNPKGYNLTWTETNNATVSYVFINDTKADSYVLRDLEEATEYSFRIYSVNEAGSSQPSEPIVITTHEDSPSASPLNFSAHALSSTAISLDWSPVPKRHRNGVVRGYKVQYQALRPEAPIQVKMIEDNSTKHITLNDLKPSTNYHLAIAAYTLAGNGVYSPILNVQTLEDTPAKPQNLSSTAVSQTTVRILWDPPEDPNGEILGYKVNYNVLGGNDKETISHELQKNERTFKATSLKPDTHYVFSVTAKTKEGWGQQASMLLYTYDSELRANLPFYRESWFVILCASLSIVVTIIVTALLFIQTKSYKYKQDAIKSTSQDRLGDAGFSIDDGPGTFYTNNGFGLLTHTGNHRRSNGAISQSTANFTLPKSPPRPNPGSVAYSDEGDDDVFEDVVEKPSKNVPANSNYDSSGESLTEKPSEISSSTAPESESADDEYVNMANRHFVNHYVNVNGTLKGQKPWKKGSRTYSTSRNKPKLPQRPAPSVPQVPGEPSSSGSSDNNPVPGTSGMQLNMPSNYAHNEVSVKSVHQTQMQPPSQSQPQVPQQLDQPLPSIRSIGSNMSQFVISGDTKGSEANNQNTQQAELLNSHIVNLNGGRIIVDNMAGSRAPLPGFTSFV